MSVGDRSRRQHKDKNYFAKKTLFGVLFICLRVYHNLRSDKLTTPRLNRNRVCINLIYSYPVSIFIIFDTDKFPLFVSFPKQS